MKFKAAVLTELNKPLAVADVETTPLQVGQVLVKILASGVCGSQLQEIAGLKGNAKFLPHLLGHEGCGIVQEVGPGITTLKVGDKVVMHWRKGQGIEAPFPKYVYNGKEMSSGKVTTLSEYSIVSENRLTAVPPDTSEELCALLGCAITTALGTISHEAGLKFGDSVMVLGCGGVGLNLIQGAKLVNAVPIIAVDNSDEKRDLSLAVGATKYVNNKKTDLDKEVAKNSIDVIIDTTGNVDVISGSIRFLSEKGLLLLVGQPRPEETLNIANASKLFDGSGKTIKATQGGMTDPTTDIPKYVKLHNAGLLKINDIITHRFSLGEINSAFTLLKTGQAGRIMINI